MSKKRIAYIVISVIFTLAFALLAAFVFRASYLRFWESVTGFWVSIKYYFCQMFNIKNDIVPTITEFSKVFEKVVPDIPLDVWSLQVSSTSYFDLLFSAENFNAWGKSLLVGFGTFGKVMTILLPIILIIIVAIKNIYGSVNTKHNKDTLPLKAFKAVSKATYVPAKRFVVGYIEFVKNNKAIWLIWLVLWIFSFNLASIIVSFFAYYFYFAVSYNFGTIYTQIVKLAIDLKVVLGSFPWYVLLPFVWLIFDHLRQKIATNKLRHMEAKNCGFINSLPIVSMACGSMGTKKTTAITDMSLSQEVMFRQKAFELIQQNDMKFPFFPWIEFERELQACMRYKTVYNLATVKEWIAQKRSRYDKNKDSNLQLYGYDTSRYGTTYDDKLKVSNLFDVLSTYAQLYFIYVIESSLLVTNYSIREDNILLSEGNFPVWNTDFSPKRYRADSKHAHILDFDILRLGKKVIEDNKKNGSFEFGVVVITEIGKERGNNLELKEVKKGTDTTNQKNDLFNSWLKMCRHSATVDNFPFIKVFTDEQRPESWGADARDLADIVTIIKSGEQNIALPFYTVEEMLCEWSFNHFVNLYYDFRYRRGDNTLLVYVLKQLASTLFKRNARLINRFGYSVLNVAKERGIMDGKIAKSKYFLMNKKIYSSRFSTDCFSDYFNDMAKKSKFGLNDYLEYATEKASVTELKSQNSYFINALYKEEVDNVSKP